MSLVDFEDLSLTYAKSRWKRMTINLIECYVIVSLVKVYGVDDLCMISWKKYPKFEKRLINKKLSERGEIEAQGNECLL